MVLVGMQPSRGWKKPGLPLDEIAWKKTNADVDRPDFPPVLEGFAPIPRERLPFPSIVVASRNDPFSEFARAEALAAAWGSRFVDVGEQGHINADAGFGPWALGERLLAALRG